VAALDRHAQAHHDLLGPGALRQVRRGMDIASGLGMPLVTVIDTPGAALSRAAEEGGLGSEIARSLLQLITLAVPTVAVLMGEGTGGGALALAPADRVIVAEHGWLAPLPPEGASVIRHGDVTHAAQLAREQGVSSGALLAARIADEVVPELPDAANEPEAFCIRLGEAVERQLADLDALGDAARLAARASRYRGAPVMPQP
jgi:acetyl-CoA carboxylase carboxyl transferase subunit beta